MLDSVISRNEVGTMGGEFGAFVTLKGAETFWDSKKNKQKNQNHTHTCTLGFDPRYLPLLIWSAAEPS